MDRGMTVEVTEQDIKQGVRCDERHCPVALALKRTTGEEWYVGIVWAGRVSSAEDKELELDRATSEWIRHFDNDETMPPFTAVFWILP